MNPPCCHHAADSERLPRQANGHCLHHPLEHGVEQPDEKAQRDLRAALRNAERIGDAARILESQKEVLYAEERVNAKPRENER